MTSTNVRYTQLATLPPEWNDLRQIDTALDNAHLDLSSGARRIAIQRDSYPFQAIVDKVYALRPSLPDEDSRNKTYLSVAKKLKDIAAEAPPQQQGLLTKILNIFSCCGCTPSCREDLVLSHDGNLTERDLLEWQMNMVEAAIL